MNSRSKNYILHAWRDNQIKLKTTQGEGGIKLAQFTLVDDNGAIDLTGAASISFDGIKRNGSSCSISCDIKDAEKGVIEFIVVTGVTDVSGEVHGNVNVVFENGNIKFDGITLSVDKNVTGKLTEASDAFSNLTKALIKVSQITPEGTVAMDQAPTEGSSNPVTSDALKKEFDKKISSKEEITNSEQNYPSIKYLDDYYYSFDELYTQEETDTKLTQKLDLSDTLSVQETNLLKITGLINNPVEYFDKELVNNTLTIKASDKYPDDALDLSVTLDDGKIICNGTTGNRDVTVRLSCDVKCRGYYLFSLQNQQYSIFDYPRIYLGNQGNSDYLIYGVGDASYRGVNLFSDVTTIYVTLLKNSSFDISFNLSLTKSEHRVTYMPYGSNPKMFVDKTDYYNDTIYPRMFGAVGDGVTDDTVALQLAINYSVENKKTLKLSGGCTYLISNTLIWNGAYIKFDGNNSTIKVADTITPFSTKSLNSVFEINNLSDLENAESSRYILRRFVNINIDCNNGRAVYGIYAVKGGKTVYQNIMINNPEFCAFRILGGNEAIISNVHVCQADINYDNMRDDYKSSVGIYISAADNYIENCVSVDFVRGFATGGTDNHFSKCHSWNAHDMLKMKNSISFDVLNGYSTFSQCTVDSTKYGYAFHKQEYSGESARAVIIEGVSAYNSIYVNNYSELGEPILFYFEPEHTLKGAALIVLASFFKAVSGINCKFDNLTSNDNKILIDQLIPHYENDSEVIWGNTHYVCMSDKADKAATLAGYGITDAYTKSYLDKKFNSKLDSRGFDTEPQLNSPNLLTSGSIYNSLSKKYDSSNIETGSGALTTTDVNSDKINSASFEYQKIGSYVNVHIYIDFKAFSISNTNQSINLSGLPFVCSNTVNPRELCVTSQKKQLAWAIARNSSSLTLLFLSTDSFAENEKLSFSLRYKIE